MDNLKTFFQTEYSKLTNFVRKYFNDKYSDVKADDILQDVALNLFSKADFDEHVENIASYVYRAIRNKIIDIQRKQKKTVSLDEMQENGDNKQLANIIESENLDEKYFEYLYSALEELKPNYRAIIIETEFNKQSFKDLSEKWDVPMGTLLSWKHRAMEKLQKTILKK